MSNLAVNRFCKNLPDAWTGLRFEFWAGSIKGDVKKKHFSLRIRGRGVSDIQPLTAAASSVPERFWARRALEIRMHRNPRSFLPSRSASKQHGGGGRPILEDRQGWSNDESADD
jgi:hypothetical protein